MPFPYWGISFSLVMEKIYSQKSRRNIISEIFTAKRTTAIPVNKNDVMYVQFGNEAFTFGNEIKIRTKLIIPTMPMTITQMKTPMMNLKDRV